MCYVRPASEGLLCLDGVGGDNVPQNWSKSQSIPLVREVGNRMYAPVAVICVRTTMSCFRDDSRLEACVNTVTIVYVRGVVLLMVICPH